MIAIPLVSEFKEVRVEVYDIQWGCLGNSYKRLREGKQYQALDGRNICLYAGKALKEKQIRHNKISC